MVSLLDYRVLVDGTRLREVVYFLEDGEWGRYYRVVKLLRLLRSPRELSQLETLLEMHRDVVASFKQFPQARLVLVAAYSRRIGLIWAYGVAVWDYELEEARKWAERLFTALKAVLRGTYRQAVFRELTVDEASEILRILSESDSVAALVGLPEPRDSYSRSPAKGYLVGTRMVEMVEEIVRGLVAEGEEFVYQVLAQPVSSRQLLRLLNRVNELLSKYSTFEETASLGLYLSLPLAYAQSRVYTSGSSVGESRGRSTSRVHSLQASRSRSTSVAESEAYSKTRAEGVAVQESQSVGFSHTRGVAETRGLVETSGSSESTARVPEVRSRSTVVPPVTRTESSSTQFQLPYGISRNSSLNLEGSSGKWTERKIAGYMSNPSYGGRALGTGFSVTAPAAYGQQWDRESYSRRESLSETTRVQPLDSSGKPVEKAAVEASEGSSVTRGVEPGHSETVTEPYTVTQKSSFKSDSRSLATTRAESLTRNLSWTRSTTRSRVDTVGKQRGTTRSVSEGASIGEVYGEASGETTVKSRTRGYSVSEGGVWNVGAIPGVTMAYSTRRIDEAKRTVYELLSVEKQRLLETLSSGGFHVQAVILGSRKAVEAAKALILGSYTPTKPWPEPLYVVEGDEELLLAARTLSLDYRRENGHPVRAYRVVNLYTSTELAALTHPPRVQVKGVEVVAENVPEFSLPEKDSWDIELGWAISHETLAPSARWGFDLEELGHIGVFGASGSGKTVTAINLAYQASAKGFRVVVIDWKYEWRRLLKAVKGKRAFYALYEQEGLPKLNWNPLRPPRRVHWREWMRVVLEWFVATYGLGSRSLAVLRKHLWNLYKKMEPTAYPSFRDLYESILRERRVEGKKASFERLDVYDKILDRLWPYAEGDLAELFGRDCETDIVDIVLGNSFVDFEAGGMSDTDKPFILSLIVFALYYYAKHNGPYGRPVLLVVEEAHQVAFNVREKPSAEAVNITEDIWGKLAAEGRAFNLYGVFIVQYPSRLNPMILANLMATITFRLNLQTVKDQDVFTIVYQLGKDPQRFGNEYARFLERLPVGHAIAVKKRTKEFFKTEPVLVKFDYLELQKQKTVR